MQPAVDQITRLLAAQFTYVPQWDKTNATLTSIRERSVRRSVLRSSRHLRGWPSFCSSPARTHPALIIGQVESRSGELALRAALGADRGRLATQLLIEVAVLGLAAGAVGSVLASRPACCAALPLDRGVVGATSTGNCSRDDGRRDSLALMVAASDCRALAQRPPRHARGSRTSGVLGGEAGCRA
jgi:hypothetical protein